MVFIEALIFETSIFHSENGLECYFPLDTMHWVLVTYSFVMLIDILVMSHNIEDIDDSLTAYKIVANNG